MPEPITQPVTEGQEAQQQPPVSEQTPLAGQEQEAQEKVYAGRFKSPEELEEAYKYSSQEGVRLAQELKRLQTQLQQAQTPKQAEAIKDKIIDLTQHFDADTAKILDTWGDKKFRAIVQEELNNFKSQTQAQSEFQKQVQDNWEETKKLYPDVADPNSKLYQRANEILFERGLAQQNPDGTLTLITPFAYRIAVEAATAELDRQAPANAEAQTKKTQAGAIQGKSSKPSFTGKMSYEQYSKLSDEEKDAYDKAQHAR